MTDFLKLQSNCLFKKINRKIMQGYQCKKFFNAAENAHYCTLVRDVKLAGNKFSDFAH